MAGTLGGVVYVARRDRGIREEEGRGQGLYVTRRNVFFPTASVTLCVVAVKIKVGGRSRAERQLPFIFLTHSPTNAFLFVFPFIPPQFLRARPPTFPTKMPSLPNLRHVNNRYSSRLRGSHLGDPLMAFLAFLRLMGSCPDIKSSMGASFMCPQGSYNDIHTRALANIMYAT